jgi:hypothetical protein
MLQAPFSSTVFFDFREQTFPWWSGGIVPLILAIFGLGIALRPALFSARQPPWKPNYLRIFGIIFFVGSLLMAIQELWSSRERFSQLSVDYSAHRYAVIEGKVTAVQPDPDGHRFGWVEVANRRFSYSTSSGDLPFHDSDNTAQLLNGRVVRIFAVGPDIIRIEVVG